MHSCFRTNCKRSVIPLKFYCFFINTKIYSKAWKKRGRSDHGAPLFLMGNPFWNNFQRIFFYYIRVVCFLIYPLIMPIASMQEVQAFSVAEDFLNMDTYIQHKYSRIWQKLCSDEDNYEWTKRTKYLLVVMYMQVASSTFKQL